MSSQNIEPLVALLAERRSLLDLAYQFLHSWAKAEEVVSEAHARWYSLDDRGEDGREPRQWLSTTVADLCRTRIGSSEGKAAEGAPKAVDDVPEAGVTWASHDQSETSSVGEAPCSSVPHTCKEASRNTTSQGRAARLGASQATAASQGGADGDELLPVSDVVADAARRYLRSFRADLGTAEQSRVVVRKFREACEAHDVGLLTRLMSPEVSAVFDGGGKVRVPDRPVSGAEQVARCLATLLIPGSDVSLMERSINARPGLVVSRDREVAAIISLDVSADQVVNAWLVVNPDKLRRWNSI